MIIGFTGTQDHITPQQFDKLVEILEFLKPTEAHHGDCIGADSVFHDICLTLGIPIVIHPPIDKSKRANCTGTLDGYPLILVARDYLDRNHDIVDASDELIAVPRTKTEQLRSGTWATYRYAKKLGKTIHLITPDVTL